MPHVAGPGVKHSVSCRLPVVYGWVQETGIAGRGTCRSPAVQWFRRGPAIGGREESRSCGSSQSPGSALVGCLPDGEIWKLASPGFSLSLQPRCLPCEGVRGTDAR